MSSTRGLGAGPLAAGALFAALALVLGLAAYYLPIVGGLLALVAPLPLAVAHIRHGARLSGLTTVAASTLAAILGGPLAAMFILSNCLIGLALGTGIRRRWPAGRTVILAGVTGFFATALSAGMAVLVIGPGVLNEVLVTLRASFAAATEALRAGFGEQVASEYAAVAERAMANAWLWIGFFTATGYLLFAWVWYGVSEPILLRLGLRAPALSPIPPAERWHLRPVVGLVFVAGYFILAVAAPHVVAGTAGELLFQLAAVVIFMGLRIQGFGLVAHLVGRAGITGGMRIVILVLVAVSALTSPILFMLLFWGGLADLALDLRGFARQRSQPAQDSKGPEDDAQKE